MSGPVDNDVDPKDELIMKYVYHCEYILNVNEFVINELASLEKLAEEREQQKKVLKEEYVSEFQKMKEILMEKNNVLQQTETQLKKVQEEIEILVTLCYGKTVQIDLMEKESIDAMAFVDKICFYKDKQLALLEAEIVELEKDERKTVMLETLEDLEGLQELCCYKDKKIISLKNQIQEHDNEEAIKKKTLESLVQQHEKESKGFEETIFYLNGENKKLQNSQIEKDFELLKAKECIAQMRAELKKEKELRKDVERKLEKKTTELKDADLKTSKFGATFQKLQKKKDDPEFQMEELKMKEMITEARQSELQENDKEMSKKAENESTLEDVAIEKEGTSKTLQEMQAQQSNKQIEHFENDMRAMQDKLEQKIQFLNANNNDLITTLDQKERELKKFNDDPDLLGKKDMLTEPQRKLRSRVKSTKSVIKDVQQVTETVLQNNSALKQDAKNYRFEMKDMKVQFEEMKQLMINKVEDIERLNLNPHELQEEYRKKDLLVKHLYSRLKVMSRILDEYASLKQKYADLSRRCKINTPIIDDQRRPLDNRYPAQGHEISHNEYGTFDNEPEDNSSDEVDIWSGIEAY